MAVFSECHGVRILHLPIQGGISIRGGVVPDIYRGGRERCDFRRVVHLGGLCCDQTGGREEGKLRQLNRTGSSSAPDTGRAEAVIPEGNRPGTQDGSQQDRETRARGEGMEA